MKPDLVERAVNAIMQADSLIIGAGAGMGVDSGLPDFRGQTGFWQAYPALAEAKIDFTEIANPMAFSNNPKMAWGFYGHRLNLYRKVKPHEGFQILKRIGERLTCEYQVFTSNVDGHFATAGFNTEKIYECHGSIHFLQCSQACQDIIWSADSLQVHTDEQQCLAISELPLCPNCGQVARPNILMFDDYYWLSQRNDQQRENLKNQLTVMKSPVVIECGAGTAIPTVRYFCESQKGTLIRINPRESFVSRTQGIELSCSALEGLKAIEKRLIELKFF
ncbi:SIR2 family NAD-dependent protein deacylase [Aliikangiella sp. IMCC44359]|uniref:SIR2 family NAD-dependent protein deacylase n=1 Tax=Aliikangiella sp. IMCC44359 TaxID=3459125 RepID=UPI00403ACCD7